MCSVSVRGETAAQIEPGLPARNHEQYAGGHDAAHNLGDDVRKQFRTGKSLSDG